MQIFKKKNYLEGLFIILLTELLVLLLLGLLETVFFIVLTGCTFFTPLLQLHPIVILILNNNYSSESLIIFLTKRLIGALWSMS